MRIAVTAGAGVFLAVGVHAAFEFRALIAVAGRALDRRDVVGMRVVLDVSMAVVAFEAAVHARREFLAVDTDAVAAAVLHCQVAMTAQAVGLSMKETPNEKDKDRQEGYDREAYGASQGVGQAVKSEMRRPHIPAACGFGHSAVFFLRMDGTPQKAHLFGGSSHKTSARIERNR